MSGQYSEDDEYLPPDPPLQSRKRTASSVSRKSSGSGSGLLSNVFSFVTREIEEFVVNATGGTEPSPSQPVAGPSHSREAGKPRTDKRHSRRSVLPQSQPDVRIAKRPRRERYHEIPSQVVGDYDDRAQDEAPSHPLTSLRHPRKTPINMPGSLFSRSPTPVDEESEPHNRRVHFASDVISPVPRQRRPVSLSTSEREVDEDDEELSQSDVEYDGGSSSSPDRVDDTSCLPLPSPPRHSSVRVSSSHQPLTPFRPSTIHSVQDAVARLDGDSPPRITKSTTSNSMSKGKEKEAQSTVPWPTVSKGPGPTLRLPSTTSSTDGPRYVDPSLRGNARDNDGHPEEPDRRSKVEDDAAKRRIRELEEKVKSLENELARRPLPRDPPPPPPPPPPPSLVSGGSTSHIPLSTSPGRGLGGVYASVRAGLRQTPNAPESSRTVPKNRIPTVPTDKMEAFLSELRTVRLRKVENAGDVSRDSTANSSSAWSARDRSQSSSQESSFTESRLPLGHKRKRVDSGNEVQSALFTSIKRRFPVQPQAGTSSIASAPSKKPFLSPSLPSRMVNTRSSMTTPQIRDIDGTTPSLCSDNDNEAEERSPSTPPLPLPSPAPLPDTVRTRSMTQARNQEHEIQDPPRQEVPEKTPSPQLSQSQSERSLNLHTSTKAQNSQSTQETLRQVEEDDNFFSRRLPSSPILPETPRRPRPPARTRSTSKRAEPQNHSRSRSQSIHADGLDGDPLAMSFSPPEKSTPVPNPVGKQRRKQRRLTLEDELRKANSSYSEEERAFAELDSGTLIGVGEKIKQSGFLAHGGAGGVPVFMSEGNVSGILAENAPSEVEKKKKGRAAAGGKRKPKR